jgi:hypothetical protein
MERATVTLETERAKNGPTLDVYDDDDDDDDYYSLLPSCCEGLLIQI